MSTNAQVLAKALRKEDLTTAEIQQLEQFAKDADDTRLKVLGIMNGNVELTNPKIRRVQWQDSPLGNYSFQRQADLSVVSNTKTFITFDTFYQHGDNFYADPNDLSKIILRYPGMNFQVSGLVQWDNNATGYRYIALEGFKSDGTSLGFVGLHLFAGTATEDNYFPVSYVADLNQLKEMAYVKFFLRQTAGVNLTCFQILLTMFIV